MTDGKKSAVKTSGIINLVYKDGGWLVDSVRTT